MKRFLKLTLCLVLSLAMLLMAFGCGGGSSADKDSVDLALFVIEEKMPASVTNQMPKLPEDEEGLELAIANYADATGIQLKDVSFDGIEIVWSSTIENLINTDGTIICGNQQNNVTFTVKVTKGKATKTEEIEANVNFPHLGMTPYKTDNSGHWQECSRTACGHKTEKANHNFGAGQNCTICNYKQVHEHSFTGDPEIISVLSATSDGISKKTCSTCSETIYEYTYAEGFNFSEGSQISNISRAAEFSFVEQGNRILMNFVVQLAAPISGRASVLVRFDEVRAEETYERDFLTAFELLPNQKTFLVSVDLATIEFIPKEQDSYSLAIEINGDLNYLNRSIASSGAYTITELLATTGYKYLANARANQRMIRISKDANMTAVAWVRSTFSLVASGGSGATLTFSGMAYMSESTTLNRVFRVWLSNDNRPAGTQDALTTGASITVDPTDTRKFTVTMNLTGVPTSNGWYKITIGLSENGGPEIAKIHTDGSTEGGTTISDGSTEYNFLASSNATPSTSVNSFKCVTAWGQVHIRR